MRHRGSTIGSAWTTSLLAAALLGGGPVACGVEDKDEIEEIPLASFAEMTPAQRERAVHLAHGGDAVAAFSEVRSALRDSVDSLGQCPQREVDGDTVTLTADGCLAPSGWSYAGRVVARNVPVWDDPDGRDWDVAADQDLEIELTSFVRSMAEGATPIDGTVWQSHAIPSGAYQMRAELEYATSDGEVRLWWGASSANGRRTIGVGAVAALPEHGKFTIAGEFCEASGSACGWIELAGVDTLRLDYDAIEYGCAPYTIDGGSAAVFCDVGVPHVPEDDERAEAAITGLGFHHVGGDFVVEVQVQGTASRVTALLMTSYQIEAHELELYGQDEERQEQVWRAVLSEGDAYTSGESTLFRYATDFDDIELAAIAEDESGYVATWE
jgi:hypothetical protein